MVKFLQFTAALPLLLLFSPLVAAAPSGFDTIPKPRSRMEAREVQGEVSTASVDPISHELVVKNAEGAVQDVPDKRSILSGDLISQTLNANKATADKYCKAVIENLPPALTTVTTTTISTATAVSTTQTTKTLLFKEIKSDTATANTPADSTITELATKTIDLTTTVEAAPETSTYTVTTTLIPAVTIVATSTYTIPFPTLDSTVRRRRGLFPQPPSYLLQWTQSQIEAACLLFIKPEDRPQQTTSTSTSTITEIAKVTTISTKTATISQTTTLTTIVPTITPRPAATRTTTSTIFFSRTTTSTTTPVTTLTSTVLDTSVTTTTSTVIQTICPSATSYVTAINVLSPGRFIYDNTISSEGGCCTRCFEQPGCNAWFFKPSNECTLVIKAPLGLGQGPATPQCPFGKGDAQLLLGGQDAKWKGGKGMCKGAGNL